MLSGLINTICGIAIYSHANACSITLQQATTETDKKLNNLALEYQHKLEDSETLKDFKNPYTAGILYVGQAVHRKSLSVHVDIVTFTVAPNRFTVGLRWRF